MSIISVSVCFNVFVSICLSVSLSVSLSVCLTLCLSVNLCLACLSACSPVLLQAKKCNFPLVQLKRTHQYTKASVYCPMQCINRSLVFFEFSLQTFTLTLFIFKICRSFRVWYYFYVCISVFVPGHYPATLIYAYELRWIRCPFILLSGYMSLLLPVGCVYLFRGNWRENLGGNEVYPLMAAPLRAGLSSTASQHHIARMLILYPGGQTQLQASSSLWWPRVWSNRLCVCACQIGCSVELEEDLSVSRSPLHPCCSLAWPSGAAVWFL